MDHENPYAVPLRDGDSSSPVMAAGYFARRRMYFWRIDRLKAELRMQPLSDRESLPYLIAYVALSTVAAGMPFQGYNVWDALGAICSVAIAVIGTFYVYRQNGGSDGQHLLQRYFAIGWVVGIRCLAAALVCMIGMLFFLDWTGQMTETTNAYEFAFYACLELTIYWRMGHHVGDVAAAVTTR